MAEGRRKQISKSTEPTLTAISATSERVRMSGITSTWLCVLFLLALLTSALQAPAQPPEEVVGGAEEEVGGAKLSSCPGYQKGNAGVRNMTGCEEKAVDHVTAFRFNSSSNPDWSACGLPELPAAK